MTFGALKIDEMLYFIYCFIGESMKDEVRMILLHVLLTHSTSPVSAHSSRTSLKSSEGFTNNCMVQRIPSDRSF